MSETPKRRDSAAGEKKKAKAEPCDWIALGLGKLERTPHVRRCLFCKELLDMCAVAEDDYVLRAKKIIVEHVEKEPEPDMVACKYSGCIHHERISKKMGMALLRVAGKGDKPWRDIRGVKVGTLALEVTEKNHPEGFDMTKQDAERRYYKYLEDSAGDLYIRFAPKITTVHVWISLSYPTRHEAVDDPATIADVRRQFEESAAAVQKWCMAQFEELKGLAEMDLQLEE